MIRNVGTPFLAELSIRRSSVLKLRITSFKFSLMVESLRSP